MLFSEATSRAWLLHETSFVPSSPSSHRSNPRRSSSRANPDRGVASALARGGRFDYVKNEDDPHSRTDVLLHLVAIVESPHARIAATSWSGIDPSVGIAKTRNSGQKPSSPDPPPCLPAQSESEPCRYHATQLARAIRVRCRTNSARNPYGSTTRSSTCGSRCAGSLPHRPTLRTVHPTPRHSTRTTGSLAPGHRHRHRDRERAGRRTNAGREVRRRCPRVGARVRVTAELLPDLRSGHARRRHEELVPASRRHPRPHPG